MPSVTDRAVTPASLSVVMSDVSATSIASVPEVSIFCRHSGTNAGAGGGVGAAGTTGAGAAVGVCTGGGVGGVVTWTSSRLNPMTTPQDVVVVTLGTRL